MNLHIIKAGLQTTLQGAPYLGYRNIGMPAAGAADCLSLFLANKLVGNPVNEAALEIPLSGMQLAPADKTVVALTGAECDFQINQVPQPHHSSIQVTGDDVISIGPANNGCRSYLSVGGGFNVETILNGQSTYQPAKIGGHNGRSLEDGDILPLKVKDGIEYSARSTPDQNIPSLSKNAILRIIPGPEFSWLSQSAKLELFQNKWTVSQRISRMGLMLEQCLPDTDSHQSMQSAAVFPGTIQCPPDGKPFILGPDAQTTGGYPRIGQVIRADRHLIGQLRPGAGLQLVETTPDQATAIYRKKSQILAPWLGNLQLW